MLPYYYVTMCWIRRSALSWKSVYDGRGGAGIKFNVVHWDGLAGSWDCSLPADNLISTNSFII